MKQLDEQPQIDFSQLKSLLPENYQLLGFLVEAQDYRNEEKDTDYSGTDLYVDEDFEQLLEKVEQELLRIMSEFSLDIKELAKLLEDEFGGNRVFIEDALIDGFNLEEDDKDLAQDFDDYMRMSDDERRLADERTRYIRGEVFETLDTIELGIDLDQED